MTVSNVKALFYFTEKLIVLVVLKQFRNHLGHLPQKRSLGSISKGSYLIGVGWSLDIYIFNKLPCDFHV